MEILSEVVQSSGADLAPNLGAILTHLREFLNLHGESKCLQNTSPKFVDLRRSTDNQLPREFCCHPGLQIPQMYDSSAKILGKHIPKSLF